MNTRSDTTISVVIPCYNGESCLREALDSALAQTHQPLEIIVIDDGSTDGSATIAKSYGDPVQVIEQPNQGESVARNRGMEAARGDWIAFLDADDVWKPNKLEKQIAAIDDGVVCVHTNYYNFGTRDDVRPSPTISPEVRYSVEGVARQNPFFVSTMIVDRNIKTRFPEWTQWGEDRLFHLDLVTEGSIRFIDEPLAGNRRWHASQTQQNSRVPILRHESLGQWLDKRVDTLDQQLLERLREINIEKLVSAMNGARFRRDWASYEEIRHYLIQNSDHPKAVAAVQSRVFPKWLYWLKDRFPLHASKR